MSSTILGIIASGGAAAAAGSSFESSATSNGAGAQTLTMSSIPGTFKHLHIRMLSRTIGTGAGTSSWTMRFNSDTGTNYADHFIFGNGSATSGGARSTVSNIDAGYIIDNGATASCYTATFIDVLDYASTSKYKTVRIFNASDTNTATSSFRVRVGSGLWMSTSAITSISFTSSQSWDTTSTFAIYGIKESA